MSFLHEAEMVSEVANSKYHSLFFTLRGEERRERPRGGVNTRSYPSIIEISPVYFI